MSRKSAELFGLGLDALAYLDASAGRALDGADDEVDDLVGELYAAIAARSGDMGSDLAV